MRIKKISTLFIFSLLASFSFSQVSFAEEMQFAFVNVAKLFDDYEKTKENDRVLQEKGRQKEEERDAIVHEVRQLKDEMLLLNEEAKMKKQGTLESKIRELQEFDQGAKQELGTQRRAVVQEIFKDIDDAVQRYGERKGVDFIFNDRALLYNNAKYDITAEILKDLNKQFSKGK